MARSQPTPLGAVVKGALAGAVGTLAMDLVWFRRYRRGGGADAFAGWEFSAGTDSYEQAAAPAQVGKRLIEAMLQTELKPDTAALMNNTVHWATGLGWGTFYGILAGSVGRGRFLLGPVVGAVAWATSYAVLAPAKLYKPMWEYDAETLWKDLSAHLVFGSATAAAFVLLAGRRSS